MSINLLNSFIKFASGGGIASSDWDVTNGGTDITINGDNIQLTGDNIKSGFYDVGEVISTSAWTLRFNTRIIRLSYWQSYILDRIF